jgi:hypothetical protein
MLQVFLLFLPPAPFRLESLPVFPSRSATHLSGFSYPVRLSRILSVRSVRNSPRKLLLFPSRSAKLCLDFHVQFLLEEFSA